MDGFSLDELTDGVTLGGQDGPVINRSVLPSGVRVLTEQMPHVRSAAIGVWVPVGSRHETTTGYGSTHFLEHLLFKGTQRRSAQDISYAFDAVGGSSNAYTGREHTYYFARVRDIDVPMALDVLLDMVTSPLLRPEDVEDERGVILEELAMDEDDPDSVVTEAFSQAVWGSHPVGRPVGGTKESVEQITAADIAQHYREHYHPGNVVVTVAGNIDHAQVCDLVDQGIAAATWQPTPVVVPPAGDILAQTLAQEPQRIRIDRPTEQAHVLVGCPSFGRQHDLDVAMQVFLTLFGSDGSSRLFQEIRERRGLAYGVYTCMFGLSDCGAAGVATGCAPQNLQQVLEIIREQWQDIADNGVTEQELARTIGGLSGFAALNVEATTVRMHRLADAELVQGVLRDVAVLERRWQAITAQDVQHAAATLLGHPMHACVLGPDEVLSGVTLW